MREISTDDGARLSVVELGPAEAPPLVVLHGGPAAHHDYLLPGFAALADERRLVLYDQRGGGRSRVPPEADLSFARHVADVAAVLDALGLARADLAGYSFGGLIAMVFAARQPARVARLALCSSAPPWHGTRESLDRALAAAQARPEVAAERAALERSGLREHAPDEYRRRRFALSVAGYFADHRLAHALTPFKIQARTAQAVQASLGDYDLRDEVAGGLDAARTLFVHGDRDPLDAAPLRELATRIGARFELLPGCGHVPYVEAPEAFFGILRAFLGGPP